MAKFNGKINDPIKDGEKYIYTVNRPPGVIRATEEPRTDEDAEEFFLDYVTEESEINDSVDEWDLTLTFQRSAPRTITVNMCLDGGTDTTDTPTVQDGKM